MYSARYSVEGDHNEEGKQLNFIQHDAGLLSLLYSMYSAGSVTLRRSPQRRLCSLFRVKSKFCRRPWLSFINQQDCSAIARARIHSCCVTSFSLSATASADLSVLKRVSKSILVVNWVNRLLSQLTSFEASQVAKTPWSRLPLLSYER